MQPFKVEPKSMKVDGFPCPIVPTIVLLEVVLVVIPIHVETHAFVVLVRDWGAVDIDGYLLIVVMVNGGNGSSETTMLSITSCEKVSSINIETCCQ